MKNEDQKLALVMGLALRRLPLPGGCFEYVVIVEGGDLWSYKHETTRRYATQASALRAGRRKRATAVAS